MIQYRNPIRRNVPQYLLYTFKDQDNNIIPLTNYTSVNLEVKLEGSLYDIVSASFILPLTMGQVFLTSYLFDTIGIWDVQFVAEDDLGILLYGEPLQIRVVPNVDDLLLNQLAVY